MRNLAYFKAICTRFTSMADTILVVAQHAVSTTNGPPFLVYEFVALPSRNPPADVARKFVRHLIDEVNVRTTEADSTDRQ